MGRSCRSTTSTRSPFLSLDSTIFGGVKPTRPSGGGALWRNGASGVEGDASGFFWTIGAGVGSGVGGVGGGVEPPQAGAAARATIPAIARRGLLNFIAYLRRGRDVSWRRRDRR